MIFIVLVKSWTPGEVTFSKVYWSNLQRFSLLCGLVPSTLRWHRMTWSGWKKFPVVQFFGSADQSHFVNAGLKTKTLRSELPDLLTCCACTIWIFILKKDYCLYLQRQHSEQINSFFAITLLHMFLHMLFSALWQKSNILHNWGSKPQGRGKRMLTLNPILKIVKPWLDDTVLQI